MKKNNISKFLIVFGLLLIMFGVNKYSSEFLTTNILGNKFLNRVNYNLYKYTTVDSSDLKVVGNYILDIKEDINEFSYNGKIIDLKGNLVYEGAFGKNVVQGLDGLLYYYPLNLDNSNRYLYKLYKGKSEKVSSKPVYSYLTFNDNIFKKVDSELLYGYSVLNGDNSEIYYLVDNSFKKVDIIGKYEFSIPSLVKSKLSYKYIVIKNEKNDSKYGVYDLISNKYIIENKYSKINYLKNNLLVACLESEDKSSNPCGVIDLYENVMLRFDYEDIFVDNYNNNYVLAKNGNRYDLYDSSLNKLLSFTYAFNNYSGYNIRKVGNNYVIYNIDSDFENNYSVLFVKNNGYYKELFANETYIFDDLIVVYDIKSNIISGYDNNFKKLYDIKDEKIKKNSFESNYSINKPVIRINNILYDIYSGKRISNDTNYVEVIGDGVKLYHSGNKLFLMINDEKYSITTNDELPYDYYISKTDSGYYFVANYITNFIFVYLEKI